MTACIGKIHAVIQASETTIYCANCQYVGKRAVDKKKNTITYEWFHPSEFSYLRDESVDKILYQAWKKYKFFLEPFDSTSQLLGLIRTGEKSLNYGLYCNQWRK